LFTIDAATGALSFSAAPDYETPADANADNVYDVTVQVSDGSLTDTQAIAVTVTPVNDTVPVITSDGGGTAASVSVAENGTAVTTVAATDADQPAQTLTYAIVGGSDAALFAIDPSTGALRFNGAPNYEAPSDADADNIYDVVVQTSDGTFATTQNLSVTVTDVHEIPFEFPLAGVDDIGSLEIGVPDLTSDDLKERPVNRSVSGTGSVWADAMPARSTAESATAVSFALYHGDSSAPVLRTLEDMIRSSRNAILAEELAIRAWWASAQTAQHNHERDEQEWRISPVSSLKWHSDDGELGAFDEWVLHAGLASLSAGVTWWTGRTTGLMATVLASVRAWQSFDLLPVLKRDETQERRKLLDDRERDEEDACADSPLPRQPKASAMQLEADE
jgi:hypothetical protein